MSVVSSIVKVFSFDPERFTNELERSFVIADAFALQRTEKIRSIDYVDTTIPSGLWENWGNIVERCFYIRGVEVSVTASLKVQVNSSR